MGNIYDDAHGENGVKTFACLAIDPSTICGDPQNLAIGAPYPMHAAPLAFLRRLGCRFDARSHRLTISFMDEFPGVFRWHHRPWRKSNDGAKLWREMGSVLLEVSLEDANAADFHRQAQQLIRATYDL